MIFFWPALAVVCYANLRKCPHGARSRLKLRRNVTRVQLFPAKELLTLVCMDILGPFIQTPCKNEHFPVITDRYSEIAKTIQMKVISSTKVLKHFVNSWVFN